MGTAHPGNAPVVAGVDGSERALAAVRWAALTAAHEHAPLELVHAAGYPDLYVGAATPPSQALQQRLRERGEESLSAAERLAEESAGVRARTRLEADSPVPLLLRASEAARMVVLGTSGRGGFVGLLLGSTTVALATHAHCPVVAVHGDPPETGPVVVGVDGSGLSERATRHAFEQASLRGAELVAVHTWSDADTDVVFSAARMQFEWEPMEDAERRVLAERLAGWQAEFPDVVVRKVVARDRPRHQLLEWSERARLLVVGSRGRGGFRGLLLGSTSQALIHHASCPVMVVRPEHGYPDGGGG
ncbi:universal stress protein [Amycolatopsis cihanbeyliensis]|uniref:Nucleotide-binding universal stress UspA family protein n=1 Tax=Amycolatopsis cihanbeyliensis TaxID=1128664 RepID=A0A542DJZ8_AMYCI|nr:universal stress protein [Amycolatopsis cihanbeyliensis]TQJ03419.1 nucleotide-binding universal stress UspA family protein [Amycolatopsis cihanbeyliensis]